MIARLRLFLFADGTDPTPANPGPLKSIMEPYRQPMYKPASQLPDPIIMNGRAIVLQYGRLGLFEEFINTL